jgi:hypothetical protein
MNEFGFYDTHFQCIHSQLPADWDLPLFIVYQQEANAVKKQNKDLRKSSFSLNRFVFNTNPVNIVQDVAIHFHY